MADRKPFLLRLPPEVMEELHRWANDELRSVNAQIEYVLRQALRARGRTRDQTRGVPGDQGPAPGGAHSEPPSPENPAGAGNDAD